MRRLGIGAAAVVLASALAPTHAVASSRLSLAGPSAFCDAGQELREFFLESGGVELSEPQNAQELRGYVEALAEVAPRSLATAFRKIVRFYRLIERGRVTALPRPDDRYSDASEAAAPASLKVARRLREECGITLRG